MAKVPRREQQRSLETKSVLLQAALTEFANNGFEGATTRWIAEQAGVNHNLIRHHFGSKEDLWKATARHVFEMYQGRIEDRLAGLEGVDPTTVTKLLLREFILFSASVPEFHRFMMQANQGDAERLSWLADEFLRFGTQQELQTLEAGQDFGIFKSGDALHLRFIFIGAATSIFTFAAEFKLLTGRDPFAPDMIEQHVDVILNLFGGIDSQHENS